MDFAGANAGSKASINTTAVAAQIGVASEGAVRTSRRAGR
jgi:hypothetical protein